MIPVTKPFLPPKEKVDELFQGIWERNWLTNNGPLVNELELRLKEYLGLDHLLYMSNGTLPLQIAIKALNLKGEVITTPFSYVATTSALVWEGCSPVFVDIDSRDFNIDVTKIADKITDKTSAILATHVFGNPCNIDAIARLAKKYKLKVIYDAAHCFGTTFKNESIFAFGDISTTSFHATKLYHTVEGGAFVTNDPNLTYRASKMRNFGHHGEAVYDGVGINAKNSEFHAALGLVNLNYAEQVLESRKEQYQYYATALKGTGQQFQRINADAGYNHAYFPIVFETEGLLLKARKALEEHYIMPRRYFYPSLSSLDYVPKSETPVSDDVAARILCLPMYFEMTTEIQDLIIRVIKRTLRY